MRYLAAALLALAALDLPFPFVDRAGVALLGLACVALALPPRPVALRRPAFVPPMTRELDDDDEPDAFELSGRDRGRRYTGEGWVEA